MVFGNLPLLEKNFHLSNSDYTLRPLSVAVPGEALVLNTLFCTPRERSGYYYKPADPKPVKTRIVLHFTAGHVRSDMEALTGNNRHISVPFVIARDGRIYQLYPSEYWSGNLGKDAVGNSGTGNAQDKCTIGIELSNFGPLHLTGNVLKTIYGDPYCSLSDTDAYRKVSSPFRGESYFATFTNAQYDSLVVLLRYLTSRHQIPRQFVPEPRRYETFADVVSFRGIVSHVNYRASGKWDIGPAFDWTRVIRDVQAPTFAPPATRNFAFFAQPALSSEDDLIALLPKAAAPETENDDYEAAAPQAVLP